jgi:hypothetical protein
MRLHLIVRGKIGRSPEGELVDRYLKRIAWPVKLTELPDTGGTIPPPLTPARDVLLDARGLAAADELPAPALLLECVLAGGDDYELVFTAPASRRDDVAAAGRQAGVRVTRIGRIDAEPGLRLQDSHGRPVTGRFASFDHFSAD